ncbi:MAG: hypothetical protein QXG00_04095 [Candidatus Woesearchaeota archaeon]
MNASETIFQQEVQKLKNRFLDKIVKQIKESPFFTNRLKKYVNRDLLFRDENCNSFLKVNLDLYKQYIKKNENGYNKVVLQIIKELECDLEKFDNKNHHH